MALQIAERVIDALRARGWKAGTAESCTGGLVAAWLTDVPGSSEAIAGGIVSYSNAVKQGLLGVKETTLAAHGAVSEETAIEMALGAKKALDVEIAVSITGIAGPGGGTPEKPVGLTWLAVAAPGGVLRTERHVWPGNREAVRSASAMRALELLLEASAKDAS